MTTQSDGTPARSGRRRVIASLSLIIAAALGAVIVDAPAASANPPVHSPVSNTPEMWAPYLDGATAFTMAANVNLTISCYLTGDSVTGPYGSENVWDMVSGGSDMSVMPGTFVPDAYI